MTRDRSSAGAALRAMPGLQPRAALAEGQRAQILLAVEQQVVEADDGPG